MNDVTHAKYKCAQQPSYDEDDSDDVKKIAHKLILKVVQAGEKRVPCRSKSVKGGNRENNGLKMPLNVEFLTESVDENSR